MDYFEVCCKKYKIYRDKETTIYVYKKQQEFILQYSSYSIFFKLKEFANVSLNVFHSYFY